MSQRRKPASAVGQARSAAGAGVNSPAPATGSQPGNAIKVPYVSLHVLCTVTYGLHSGFSWSLQAPPGPCPGPQDAVVVGKAYLVEPKFRQANDDIVFLVSNFI